MSHDPGTSAPRERTRSGWRVGSRLADLLVLAVGVVSLVALAEMAIRPFYAPPLHRPAPQVQCDYSPRFGWSHHPLPAGFTLDAPVRINARGLRGSEAAYGSDSTASRWLLLGGGTTFGVGVPEEATFGALAAELVAADTEESITVINAGVEGYDLYQCLRFLREEGRFYHPDVIVVAFEPEDLPSTGVRDTLFSPERFAAVARRVNRPAEPRLGFVRRLLRASRLVSFAATRLHGFRQLGRSADGGERARGVAAGVRIIDILNGRETPALESAWRTVEGEFAELRAVARSLGAAVYVVVLPLSPQLSRRYPRARYQERLEAICRQHAFVMVDPLPPLREARRSLARLYLPRLPFLSAEGHRIVAAELRAPLGDPELRRSQWLLPSQAQQ